MFEQSLVTHRTSLLTRYIDEQILTAHGSQYLNGRLNEQYIRCHAFVVPDDCNHEVDQARRTAMEAGLKYVYVGRVTGHEGETARCAACDHPVISRLGFFVDEVNLENGRCDQCGEVIDGRWSA